MGRRRQPYRLPNSSPYPSECNGPRPSDLAVLTFVASGLLKTGSGHPGAVSPQAKLAVSPRTFRPHVRAVSAVVLPSPPTVRSPTVAWHDLYLLTASMVIQAPSVLSLPHSPAASTQADHRYFCCCCCCSRDTRGQVSAVWHQQQLDWMGWRAAEWGERQERDA